MAKTKIAFIGPELIHNAFTQMDPNWDFQSPVESLDEFSEELNSGDKIAPDTSVIIFFSQLYKGEDKTKFALDVASLAPYTATMILYTDGDEEKTEIQAAVKAAQNDQADETEGLDDEYNPDTPFYFVRYEDPTSDINDALTSYIKDDLANDEARDSILQSLPDSVRESLEQQAYDDSEFEENDTDDFGYDEELSTNGEDLPEANPDATGKVITVTSSKGGSGKSTVSLLLATYLAKGSLIASQENELNKAFKVVVVDLDTRDGQLGFLNGAQDPSVVDILVEGAPTKESIKKGIWHNKNMGVDFIFSAKRPRNAAAIPNAFYGALVQKLREVYDYVILDTSVNYLDPLLDKVAYPAADSIVFVSDIGISSIFGMMRWIRETTQSDDETHVNIDPTKIGVVINKVLNDVNMDTDKIEAAASGLPIWGVLPSFPGIVTYAANTSSMDQVLNQPIINAGIKNVAETLVARDGRTIAEVPSIHD